MQGISATISPHALLINKTHLRSKVTRLRYTALMYSATSLILTPRVKWLDEQNIPWVIPFIREVYILSFLLDWCFVVIIWNNIVSIFLACLQRIYLIKKLSLLRVNLNLFLHCLAWIIIPTYYEIEIVTEWNVLLI